MMLTRIGADTISDDTIRKVEDSKYGLDERRQ
ncbi:MAG: hypothetical protein ACJAXW_003269 [Candidatus Azotimanducaceae bacterium]|jgi:hypothetical protein